MMPACSRSMHEFMSRQRYSSRNDFVEIAKHPVIVDRHALQEHADRAVGRADGRLSDARTVRRQRLSSRLRARTIHPLAKIAAVADAYVALVSPRPHRPAMLPYHAVAKLLGDVKQGLLIQPSFAHCCTQSRCFRSVPSSNSTTAAIGKAIRANGPSYDRPMVEAWQRTNLERHARRRRPDRATRPPRREAADGLALTPPKALSVCRHPGILSWHRHLAMISP